MAILTPSNSNSTHDLQELDLEDAPMKQQTSISVDMTTNGMSRSLNSHTNMTNGHGHSNSNSTSTTSLMNAMDMDHSHSQCQEDGQLRVLIYSTCYNVVDGVTLTIRKLEREILEAGHHLTILTTKSGNPDNTNLVPPHPNRQVLFLDNSMVIPMQADPKNPKISYHLGLSISPTILSKLDNFQPNVIHITTPDCTALHLLNYARRRQIPLMGTYHSNIPDYMLFVPGLSWVKPILEVIFRHLYNFLQVLFVPTPFIKETLTRELQMDCVTNVKVWGRGVDLQRFSPSHRSTSFRQQLGIPNNCPIVLYVGRLVPEKRPDIFASVIRRLSKENIYFRAIIVGAGQSEHIIENLPNTIHTGWLDGDQLCEAYASSDVFLFPSSVETFGNVTLEAAASGLPLVVEEKCSGHLVNHGVNGFLCEAGNVQAFYDGTVRLLRDVNLRASFSEQSKALSQTLEQSVVVKEMLDHYQDTQKEFYDTYGGSHQARDEAFRIPGSFKLGTDPRPFGFGLLEFVILGFFSVGTKILGIITWLQERFPSRPQYDAVPSTVSSASFHDGMVENGSIEMYEEKKDEEMGTTSSTFNSNGLGSGTSDDIEEAAADDPGLLVSCMIMIGDSKLVLKSVLLFLSVVMFFFRTMSALKGSCRSCCGAVVHRIDAYRGSSKREV